MIRTIDWRCSACATEIVDALASDEETKTCACGAAMEQVWWGTRKRNAQWDDSTSVMVMVNDDPSCPEDVRLRYPGRHDARLPAGYRRVFLRSLPEVNRFEREHQVACHNMHYDSNGHALDDAMVRD